MARQRQTPEINSCCPSRPFEIRKVKVESSTKVSDIARERWKPQNVVARKNITVKV